MFFWYFLLKNFNPLLTPIVEPKYKKYRDKYDKLIETYVNHAIDESFPTEDITLEEGTANFKSEISKFIEPIVKENIDKLNISPLVLQTGVDILNSLKTTHPQLFKLF